MSILQDEMWKCYTAFLIRDMPMSGSPSCVHICTEFCIMREKGEDIDTICTYVRR